MTPFSPSALLAILLAFYPDVSAAALAQARRERPDYFAGGTLGGSHGDKMTLPDGRGWDLIYDVENATGNRHWQVLEVTGQGAAADPLFTLDPGPLTPLDGSQWPVPHPVDVFGPLVAAALRDTTGQDQALATAYGDLAAHSSPAALDAVFNNTIAPAGTSLDEESRLMHLSDLDGVLAQTQGGDGGIDREQGEYVEPVPPELPTIDPDQALPGLPPGGDIPPDWP